MTSNRSARLRGALCAIAALAAAALVVVLAVRHGDRGGADRAFRYDVGGHAQPGTGAAAGVSGGVPGPRAFSATNLWNTPLAPRAPVDERSGQWVKRLVGKVRTNGSWINTTRFGTPVYEAGPGQPAQPVVIDGKDAAYQLPFVAVPIPPGAEPSSDSDSRIVIHQAATDTLWEFWRFRFSPADRRYHASAGGRIVGASTSDGVYRETRGYSASATGLSIAAGLITPDELRRGSIDHMVALGIPHPLDGRWWSAPARRSDGDSSDPYDVPEGARFRLPQRLNLKKLGLPRPAYAIARAVQRYGMIVRDKSDSVVFYAQDPRSLGGNPYPALFGGRSARDVLAKFPWAKLQAVRSEPNRPWPG